MRTSQSIAFVDVETTGLSPTHDRVAEIGVITVDGDSVDSWTTFVASPPRLERGRRAAPESPDSGAPTFRDIAADLAQRLSAHLFVAHNARFDHSFIKAEFDRVGIEFHPEVLCSVMLSRRLHPQRTCHDLDALVEAHGLRPGVRHRALPDADMLWQWWQSIHREFPAQVIDQTVSELLAGPVLPPHLDPALIEALPESPGAYMLHGEGDIALQVGAAANLKLHVRNYFRIDRMTDKALEYSHRITRITWRATRGVLGARLHAAALAGTPLRANATRQFAAQFTWRFTPQRFPAITIETFGDTAANAGESFGTFATERKAYLALVRLASRERLCHCLLGIEDRPEGDHPEASCTACGAQRPGCDCVGRSARNRHLVRLQKAILPMRIDAWPYAGPVGVRERTDIHVIDQWRYLGTARSEGDAHELLRARRGAFDKRLYGMLRLTLRALSANAVLDLSGACPNRAERVAYARYERESDEPIPHAAEPAGEWSYPTCGSDEFG
jgi:DNA polymerase-3 subunit epsilon